MLKLNWRIFAATFGRWVKLTLYGDLQPQSLGVRFRPNEAGVNDSDFVQTTELA